MDEMSKISFSDAQTTRVVGDNEIDNAFHLIEEATHMNDYINQEYSIKKLLNFVKFDDIDYEVTLYFPKKFEALWKFYLGK